MFVGVLTTCHTQYTSFSRCNPIYGVTSRIRFMFLLFPQEVTNQNRHSNHHRWHVTDSLERTGLSCWCLYNHKGCTYRAPVRYVTKTGSVVLLNKRKHILLSEVYCVWQVVKTPTVISNNPVLIAKAVYGVFGTAKSLEKIMGTFFKRDKSYRPLAHKHELKWTDSERIALYSTEIKIWRLRKSAESECRLLRHFFCASAWNNSFHAGRVLIKLCVCVCVCVCACVCACVRTSTYVCVWILYAIFYTHLN